ncbi:MAG: GntR family transcriptional regulator [Acidobacteria bacterium]|nr:GntR family transcriptional regulator [Acidobacteriota bacterium]
MPLEKNASLIPDVFTPVESRTLRENVCALIEEAILSGKLRPGERLNESHLARQLKVSRAPIREALQQLHEKGLAMNTPRKGMYVVSLEEGDVQKINRLRVLLEAEALRLCRSGLNPMVSKELIAMVDTMEASTAMPPLRMVQLDMEFHRMIWATSGNEYLLRMLHSLTAPLFAHALLRNLKSDRMRMVLRSHRPVLDYLLGELKIPAEEVVSAHIDVRWSPKISD